MTNLVSKHIRRQKELVCFLSSPVLGFYFCVAFSFYLFLFYFLLNIDC